MNWPKKFSELAERKAKRTAEAKADAAEIATLGEEWRKSKLPVELKGMKLLPHGSITWFVGALANRIARER